MKSKRGLGPEDLMHKQFGSLISKYEKLGLLKCKSWSYDTAGEYRTLQTASLLKAKGAKKGKPDYSFRYSKDGHITGYIYIEMKAGKNKQTKEQIEFEESCASSDNENYFVIYSVSDALDILQNFKILDI